MQKIVINSCYGGFSISAKAVKRMAELNGKPCYLFKGFGENGYNNPCSLEDLGNSYFSAFAVPNPIEAAKSQDNWSQMSMEERRASNKRWSEISLDNRPSKRDDPILIKVVEELGKEANGRCAELKIVEIPDGVEWEIDEYDGVESVEEKHRSWS